MKTMIVSALLGLFGAAALAQEAPPVEQGQPSIMAPAERTVETPAAPAQPAVETPAKPAVETPAAPAQPAVETPAAPAQLPAEIPVKPAVETPAPLTQPAVAPQPPVEIPAKPAVETPVVPAQPAVKAAPVWNNMAELKKSHGQAVADLKKKQEEDIKQLKASMKGKPIAEMRAAVEKQRTSDKAALKTLKDAQNAEIGQFKKDHPEAVKKIEEVKRQEIPAPAVPEKK